MEVLKFFTKSKKKRLYTKKGRTVIRPPANIMILNTITTLSRLSYIDNATSGNVRISFFTDDKQYRFIEFAFYAILL